MKKSNFVFAVLFAVSPVATQADQILFEFIGGEAEEFVTGDIWTMQGSILIDEADVIPGVNLVPFFDSWEFSWTNGTETWSSTSLDSVFLPETPIDLDPIYFIVNAAGDVESSFLCSDNCSLFGHPEFQISIGGIQPNWKATWIHPLGEYLFVVGHPASFVNRGPVPQIVEIATRPGSEVSPINLRSKGMIPVAALTTNVANGDLSDFDATQIDPATLMFGPNDAVIAHAQGHLSDVDGDGDIDLVVHFRVQETGISCGDTEATLTGETYAGNSIVGAAAIQTVGCN